MTTRHKKATPAAGGADSAGLNEVRLEGRVSGAPESRTMPSGDELVQFRLVVRRPGPVPKGGQSVDTLDIACWSGRARQRARRLSDGDRVEVSGSLRRRFFRAGGGAASRYEVAAETVRAID